ncbi:GGDEF domain-containing protein [Limimaricola litoreus]|uniref:diguanylate cyclase n=1 Tax=Limimaricola litoreus TaxID=2955316 RepID=A0A9X2JNH0_9RHOB|nr:GGDEF domain-containing protein [Limimaricola litoreus]MCP1168822.1 GGDEF domain-containing protein [Limimaricola litoreus]
MPLDSARQFSARNFGEVRDAIRIIRWIDGFRNWLSLTAGTLCVLAVAGYVFDLRALYLPVAEGGGTHPLTALAALALALARMGRGGMAERTLAGSVLFLLALRGVELFWPATPLPIGQWLGALALSPTTHPDTMTGLNSLIALAAIAAALLVERRSVLGMAALAAAAGVCSVVIVAYSYALQPNAGGMSPVTTLITLLLVLATVGRHMNPLALRLLMAESSVSRMLRRQLGLALGGFWIGGLLLLQLQPGQWTTVAPLFTTVMLVLAVAGLMSTVAMLAGTENARQLQQAALERLSVTDALTGLANRRACDVFAKRVVAAAEREGTGLAVVLIDIDKFKTVNDRFGHAAGDRLLSEVGHLLPRWLRRSDLAARWGGEEFLLILGSTRLTGAIALAERVRGCFEERLSLPDGSAPVTASIGCAELLPGETSIDAAISRADAALYRAKAAGRNRVEPCLPAPSPAQAATCKAGKARRAADVEG